VQQYYARLKKQLNNRRIK